MTKTLTLDALPAFASDEAIAVALMGPRKAGEWKHIAALLEERGLPKIDHLMGGRYPRGHDQSRHLQSPDHQWWASVQ